jgi:WD40 repeat protein
MAFRKWRDMMYRASGRQVTGAFAQVKEDGSGVVKESKGFVAGLIESPKSYGVFSQRNGVRIVCAELSNHWAFEGLSVCVILVACVAMCLQAEDDSGARVLTSAQEAMLTGLNAFVMVYFIFEFTVKTVYMGVWVAPTSYLRSSWLNRLDAIATLCAFISLVSSNSDIAYFQLLRIARCLTPVRLVNKFKPVSRVLVAVAESWFSVVNVATVTVASWIMFALIGMQLFGGFFNYCSDPAFPPGAHRNAAVSTSTMSFPDGCSGMYEDTKTGLMVEREWTTAYLNFDDFFSAIYCTLTIFSLDGWDRIYFSAVDGVDPDVNPVVNENKIYAVYFIFIILISFVTLQMIVGAMYGAFMYLNSTSSGSRISSLKVAFWQIYSTKLRYIEPLRAPARPAEGWRLKYFMLVKTRIYAQVIIALTLVSVGCRFLIWGTSGPFFQAPDWVRIVDFVFAVVFFFEWLVRFSSFSAQGVWLNWYDKSDTVVTLVVLVYAFLDIIDMQDGFQVWSVLGFELYSLLCGCVSLRLLRLIPFMPETHACFIVVRKSMSTLLAMAALTTIITLAYAIVGVTLFGKYSDDFEVDTDASLLSADIYSTEHANFKKVLPAMQLLYYIGTGADFAGVMQQATSKTPGSVSWLVPIYILSYLILIKYIIFSVCVLVVVYKFTLHATDVNGLAMDAIEDFRTQWQLCDPSASGDMLMKDFPAFVRSLKKPLGVDATASHLEVDRYIKKTLLVMGFSAADIVGATEELPYTVKFKRTLIAMHYLIIFGDAFGDDSEYLKRRVTARNRIRQFKYGVASQIVKIRESAGGANSETSTGTKDLSLLRSLLPRVFEQRLLKSCLHEIYRLRVQIQFKGYTTYADKEADLLLKVLREEYEAAALQNQRLKLELEAVIDKFRLEMAQQRNFRYLSLLRQLVRHVSEEREKHIMRTWRLDTMQLHSKFRVRDPITRVAVSENGEFLLTASTAKIHAWRMKKPSAAPSAPLYALCWGAKQSANVLSLACTADAKRFFSGHDDHCIRSWQEDSRGKSRKVKHSGKFTLLLQMRGHEGPVYDLLMYEGYLLSCGGDATIRFWRARSEETLQSSSLASNMDLSSAIGMQVPGVSGTGCFCMCTFNPILDMNKFTEKDIVTQLLVGTSDGQVAAFVLRTDNAFLYTQEWVVSATVSVSGSKEEQDGGESAFATLGGVLSGASMGGSGDNVSVTSVVCPNRFGDTWELCYAGTSAGEIKIYEMLWQDPLSGSKKEVRAFKPLWQHNVHSGPVSCLCPAGGWLFSASHDMSVVAWREPTVHAAGVAQGHEDGYVAHQGRVTSMCATSEMIFSVDDSGILLVRNSREKNEVKFIDGEGARVVARLSETAKARMVNELKSAFTARKAFSLALTDFTRTPADEYADLLVPDVWMDTKNPETSFQNPKFLEPSLRDDALTHFTFLGQLCRHYFPKREIDREIPLEVKRWIDTRTVLAKKTAIKSETNMSTPTEQLLAAQHKQTSQDKEEEAEAAMRADPTALVNANKNATDAEGAPVVSIDLNGWVVQMPLSRERTGKWLVEEACRAYHAQKGEGIDANQLVPRDSMVEVPLDVPLGQLGAVVKPGSTLAAMYGGGAPKSYRVGTMSIDIPIRKVGAENSDARRQWEAQYKKEMSELLGGVKPSRVQILSLDAGATATSVAVEFKIHEEPGNPHAKSPTDLFRDLQAKVEEGDAQVGGGDVPPGKFQDKTREVASARPKEDAGIFGFVGDFLTGIGAMSGTVGGEDEDSEDEDDEDSEEESEYSDESDAEGEGFDDDPAELTSSNNPLSAQAEDDDDTSSLALSVAERGRRHKKKMRGHKKGYKGGEDVEEKRKQEESERKGTLMSWMGLSSANGAGDGGSVVSQSTVASGVSYDDDGFDDDDHFDEDDDFEDEEDPMGYEGVEATEMVDLQAMDSRMESLSAWASAKQKEKSGLVQPAVPKENMKQWVAAKAQGSGGGADGGDSQSLREWLLFDVALDHSSTEEIEGKLREAGFDSLAAMTSSYAVITDRSLKDMGIRKMGHRAQLLTHLDSLRNKVGATARPTASASESAGGGILSSLTGGVFTQEYGLASRLQQMEAERDRERDERERQLKEIADLKDVVLSALQDPEKRAMVQGQQAGSGRIGKLLGVLGSGGGGGGGKTPRGNDDDDDDAADYDDDDDSAYSGDSDAASSALGESVGDAAEDIYSPQNLSPEETARSGREVATGRVFGIDLGKTQLQGRRDGIETANAVVKSYKHPYFTVVYDGSGEAEYLTLGEVQGLMEQDARQMALDAAAANQRDDASDSEEDSGDE